MQYKKIEQGFALLNILLGISLLSGVIFLIMHAMSNYHSEENSRAIGEQFAPVISALLQVEDLSKKTNGTYSLIANTSTCGVGNSNPLLVNVIASGYLQSLQTSGFDLCVSKNVVICDTLSTTGDCA